MTYMNISVATMTIYKKIKGSGVEKSCGNVLCKNNRDWFKGEGVGFVSVRCK